MTYGNGVISCKSVSPYFEAEATGIKPNTVRVVPAKELVSLASCTYIEVLHAGPDGRGRGFKARITSIIDITDALAMSGCELPAGEHAVTISWGVQL